MATNDVETTQNGSGENDDKPISSIGVICELMKLDHRYDKNGQAIVVPKVESPGGDHKGENFEEFALVYRRIFNAKHELVTTRVDINSRFMLRVFTEIVEYYPSHPERFNETLVVDSPYQILYHHWPQLKDYRDSTDDDETRMHLDFLLDFMDHELNEDSKKADRLVETGHISFPLLWTIFRPGELVVHRLGRDLQRLWRLIEMSYDQDNRGRYLNFKLAGTDYDGTETGRTHHWEELRESAVGKGSIITKLDIYPLRFASNQDQIIQKITERGQKFLDHRGIHIRRYEGQLQMLRRPPLNFFSSNRRDYAGTFTPYNVSLCM
jgi:hypothetical protein